MRVIMTFNFREYALRYVLPLLYTHNFAYAVMCTDSHPVASVYIIIPHSMMVIAVLELPICTAAYARNSMGKNK